MFSDETLSSKEVCALLGVTLRQLQWWDERGYVKPLQVGHARHYSCQHILRAAIITELHRQRVRQSAVKSVTDKIENLMSAVGTLPMESQDTFCVICIPNRWRSRAIVRTGRNAETLLRWMGEQRASSSVGADPKFAVIDMEALRNKIAVARARLIHVRPSVAQ